MHLLLPVTGRRFPKYISRMRVQPLGWSSWNAFRGSINEERIMNTSHLLVSTGLRDAGFIYVNLDDCWMDRFRDNETGELRAVSWQARAPLMPGHPFLGLSPPLTGRLCARDWNR